MQHNDNITASYVRQILDYDPETGIFVWRVKRNNRIPAGSVAGRDNGLGYIRIGINGRNYKAHRLAWLITYGQWPSKHIDHIDGNRANNMISNLREASVSQNSMNRKLSIINTSGYKGVYWHTQVYKWQARIMIHGKAKHLGLFDTAEEAHAAYCLAADRLHGEFANYGIAEM